MVVDGTFLKSHTFDQGVLLAVTSDSDNTQILLSSAVVTSDIEDIWVWLRHQLEHNFPGTYICIVDYSMWIQSHQFQGDIRNSGCLLARCLKHLSENAEKAIISWKGKDT